MKTYDDDDALEELSNPELGLDDKRKEYYVKGEDLKNEIRKYQESKKNDPERKAELSLKSLESW